MFICPEMGGRRRRSQRPKIQQSPTSKRSSKLESLGKAYLQEQLIFQKQDEGETEITFTFFGSTLAFSIGSFVIQIFGILSIFFCLNKCAFLCLVKVTSVQYLDIFPLVLLLNDTVWYIIMVQIRTKSLNAKTIPGELS